MPLPEADKFNRQRLKMPRKCLIRLKDGRSQTNDGFA
jgi:hypothetical protein